MLTCPYLTSCALLVHTLWVGTNVSCSVPTILASHRAVSALESPCAPPARRLSSWSRDPSRLPSRRSRSQAPVTRLQALRGGGGQGGTLIPPGPCPRRRRAPARRRGARRDASSGRPSRVGRRSGSPHSPGQRQVLGATVLVGVLLRRGRRRRRGCGSGRGGCSPVGFGWHDALPEQEPASGEEDPGRRTRARRVTPRPLQTPVTKII